MTKERVQYLILGAGVVGLALAREILTRRPSSKVLILEKESELAFHSSGRNSGVLHAGFYYTPDSLKAKFTAAGNAEMRQYCASKGIPVLASGKLVVAQSEVEHKTLLMLHQRGTGLGIELLLLSEPEVSRIDPAVRTFREALFSPNTGIVNPRVVCQALAADILALGGELRLGAKYLERTGEREVKVGDALIEYDLLINSAGLYADRIARDFGLSQNYRILPFKGVYLKRINGGARLKTNVYPVPNLANPFLGVHFTLTGDGSEKIGPTAMPAFWRENYHGLFRFNAAELFEILKLEGGLFLRNDFNFRGLARAELAKHWKGTLVREAEGLLKGKLDGRDWDWGPSGIRAQLIDLRTRTLAKDFVVEKEGSSIHVLNSVSPAFTGSIPFAKYVMENFLN